MDGWMDSEKEKEKEEEQEQEEENMFGTGRTEARLRCFQGAIKEQRAALPPTCASLSTPSSSSPPTNTTDAARLTEGDVPLGTMKALASSLGQIRARWDDNQVLQLKFDSRVGMGADACAFPAPPPRGHGECLAQARIFHSHARDTPW